MTIPGIFWNTTLLESKLNIYGQILDQNRFHKLSVNPTVRQTAGLDWVRLGEAGRIKTIV